MSEVPSLIFDSRIAQVNAGGEYSLTWAIQWVCAAPREGMVLAM